MKPLFHPTVTLLLLISGGVLLSSPSRAQYAGGDGRGDIMSSLNGITASRRILWTGQVNTNWNVPGNWYPTAVPTVTDSIAIEQNGNGVEPYLDQSRNIHSIDFNAAGKKVRTGSYNLTITDRLINPDQFNYVRTDSSGRLIQFIQNNQEITYPCGKSSYNPVSIRNRTNINDWFSARVEDTVYANGYTTGSIIGPHVRRTWYISNSPATANLGQGVDLHLQWNEPEELGPITAPLLYHYNGSGWENPVSAQPTPWIEILDSTRIYHFEGYKKSFSAFMLKDGNNPLPVTLSRWEADCGEEQLVELTWITSAEINNDFFSIERSEDGKDFEAIAHLCGAGNSNQEISYFYTDSSSGGGSFYYRLRQTDFDNGTKVYRMIYISCGSNSDGLFFVYPNPTDDQIHIRGIQEKTTLLIQSLNGAELKKEEISPESPTTRLKQLGAGLYFLKIRSGSETQTQKIFVKP